MSDKFTCVETVCPPYGCTCRDKRIAELEATIARYEQAARAVVDGWPHAAPVVALANLLEQEKG